MTISRYRIGFADPTVYIKCIHGGKKRATSGSNTVTATGLLRRSLSLHSWLLDLFLCPLLTIRTLQFLRFILQSNSISQFAESVYNLQSYIFLFSFIIYNHFFPHKKYTLIIFCFKSLICLT